MSDPATLRDEDVLRIGEYVKPWLRELVDQLVPRREFFGIGSQLLERMVRVEEELKSQRELMDERFGFMERRFEAVDRRFEAVDQRFEDLLEHTNQRFSDSLHHLDKRFNTVTWNGCGAHGSRLAPGSYFYRFRAGDFQTVRKLLTLR